jgi:arylsulfatase A-like enzyme
MSRPNVLLIICDNWPARFIGALGHPAVLTPTLNQFLYNGIAFTNAYATTPMCVPQRRELHSGTFARTHGDRLQGTLPFPNVPSLAQTFRNAGYQAYAVGKMHLHPQRDRIGFDDVLLHEAGRMQRLGSGADDYELFLTEQGHAGQEFAHGVGNNSFIYRPWHLPEHVHPTTWTAREMARFIVRRDPTRPAFWYMSFDHVHPPLTPPSDYWALYEDIDIDMPLVGEWAKELDQMPFALRTRPHPFMQPFMSDQEIRTARRAFYALSTQVDHQIRTVIGTLREEGVLDDTIVMFTADHSDMLGSHGIWGKGLFYEDSAHMPLILCPTPGQLEKTGYNRRDDRLATLADVMPTLLELCDIPVPSHVEGLSLLGEQRRDYIYGEYNVNDEATRMIRDGRFKLIYYPVGNRFQLFDMEHDPNELVDLAEDDRHRGTKGRLTELLIENLYGSDEDWLAGGELVGVQEPEATGRMRPRRDLGGQRGLRFR